MANLTLPFRTRRQQSIHLPLTSGVHRHRSRIDISAFWQCPVGQGVHRQADQPVQVLRLRLVRQSTFGQRGHPGDARISDRDQAVEGPTKTFQGCGQAVLDQLRWPSPKTPST